MPALTLPEEFVLLLHRPNGQYYVTADQTAAAEVGELVMRHRIEFVDNKISLLDPSPTGMDWADQVLEVVGKSGGARREPVTVSNALWHRNKALRAHRGALVEYGLLEHRAKKTLGIIPDDRYVPDQRARDGLLAEIRQVARDERTPDNRLALLCALVHASGLVTPLRFDREERAVLKSISKGEHLGQAVEATVAAAAAAVAVTATVTVSAGGN